MKYRKILSFIVALAMVPACTAWAEDSPVPSATAAVSDEIGAGETLPPSAVYTPGAGQSEDTASSSALEAATETPSPTPAAATETPSETPAGGIPEGDPVNTVQFAYGKSTITYSNGDTAEYGPGYKALIIDGNIVKSDVKTVDDYTLVPIRALVEALGGTVGWDDSTRTVTISKGDLSISMVIGSKDVIVNGESQTTAVAPNIYDDYTYLPIRFVSETLGAQVAYVTGQYDADNSQYNDFEIVQGIQGNVIVDEFDPSWPVIPKDTAEATIKTVIGSSFQGFMPYYSGAHPGKDYSAQYALIQSNIDNTKVIGEVSRYYVVESASLFLFDKFTSTIYTVGSDANSNWISKYVTGQSVNYKVFTSGYLDN